MTPQQLHLTLIERVNRSSDVITFLFAKPANFNFTAGQFMEWELPHPRIDSRGTKRFFTISASPTEDHLALTTKFADKRSSSFKQALHDLSVGQTISAANVEGDFVVPTDQNQKLAWIAGGIGITPFRSQLKYLVDTNAKRDIIFLYSNKTRQDIVFRDLLQEAETKVGLQTNYVLTDEKPAEWDGQLGYIDEAMIKKSVPDWQDRVFYVSGPEPMVEQFETMLAAMGLADSQLMRDFFPGYTETHQAS